MTSILSLISRSVKINFSSWLISAKVASSDFLYVLVMFSLKSLSCCSLSISYRFRDLSAKAITLEEEFILIKSNLGLVSKQIVEKINEKVRSNEPMK